MFMPRPSKASMAALISLGALGLQIHCASTGTNIPATSQESISGQPADLTVTAPGTATFSVLASAGSNPTYQWTVNDTLIPGATGSSYTTPATTIGMNGNTYAVNVWNGVSASAVRSREALLTVDAPPVIITQPASVTAAAGTTATFSVEITGNPSPTFQWNLGGAAIAGAISASYTTPAATSAMNGGSYTVAITNSLGTVTSTPAILTVD